ncbi:hypothetical protein Tco_0356133 [Tanacetum coccineum]
MANTTYAIGTFTIIAIVPSLVVEVKLESSPQSASIPFSSRFSRTRYIQHRSYHFISARLTPVIIGHIRIPSQTDGMQFGRAEVLVSAAAMVMMKKNKVRSMRANEVNGTSLDMVMDVRTCGYMLYLIRC